MGQDQSSPARGRQPQHQQGSAQKKPETPQFNYTSYSVSRQHEPEADDGPPPTNEGIMVVNAGVKRTKVLEHELEMLKKTPVFYPILKNIIGMGGQSKDYIVDSIESKHAQSMCVRLQSHVRASANCVVGEQFLLCREIQRVEIASEGVRSAIQDHRGHLKKNVDKIKTASDLRHVLETANRQLEALTRDLNGLNALLPNHLQLAPLSVAGSDTASQDKSKASSA